MPYVSCWSLLSTPLAAQWLLCLPGTRVLWSKGDNWVLEEVNLRNTIWNGFLETSKKTVLDGVLEGQSSRETEFSRDGGLERDRSIADVDHALDHAISAFSLKLEGFHAVLQGEVMCGDGFDIDAPILDELNGPGVDVAHAP